MTVHGWEAGVSVTKMPNLEEIIVLKRLAYKSGRVGFCIVNEGYEFL